MSIQQDPTTLPTNVAVARVLMFLQGGAYVALVLLGYLAFFAFRGRMQQRAGGQSEGGAQFAGRAILFSVLIVALGVLIIFLAVRIGRFSSGALITSAVIEGIITTLALVRVIRSPDLLPIILFAFPAVTFIFLLTGLRSFSSPAKSISNESAASD